MNYRDISTYFHRTCMCHQQIYLRQYNVKLVGKIKPL